MNLEQSYQKKNRCYKNAVRRSVTGITLYYQTATRSQVQSLLLKFNTQAATECVHAIIVGDKIIQTLPWDYQGRVHGGKGNKSDILLLIFVSEQEMDTESVYENTVELCALLCRQYGLQAETAITSYDRHIEGLPSVVAEQMKEITFNEKPPYQIIVTAAVLNVREGPSIEDSIIGKVKRDEEYTVLLEKDNWGKLKERQGYISLAYTKLR